MTRDILAVFVLFGLIIIGGIATAFTLKKALDNCVTSVSFQQEEFNQ